MIDITQNTKLDKDSLIGLLAKYKEAEFQFSGQTIEDDIAKLNKIKQERNNRITNINVDTTIDYLKRLYVRSSKPVKMIWEMHNGRIVSYPIEMKDISMFNIKTCDYILLMNEKLITIDISELLNIMAFEAVYRDLSDSDKPLEELDSTLENLGITTIGIYDSSKLKDVVPSDSYKSAMNLLIGDSKYLSADREVLCDYFSKKIGIKDRKKVHYRDWMESSANTTMLIVLESILNKASKHGIKLKIAGIYDKSISLVVGNDVDTSKFIESISIRICGRRFETHPIVMEY